MKQRLLSMTLAVAVGCTAVAQTRSLVDRTAFSAPQPTTVSQVSELPIVRAAKTSMARHAPLKASEGNFTDEDFSLWTEGTPEEPVYLGYIDGFIDADGYVDASRTKAYGWWTLYASSAGECVDLGTVVPGWGGCINTPRGQMYGHVSISARVKVQSTETASRATITVSIDKGSDYSPTPVTYSRLYANNDGEWHTITFEYDCEYTGQDAWVQFDTYNTILIDDIKISVDSDGSLAEPQMLSATDFTYDGFTANWMGVDNATHYLLTCYALKPVSDLYVEVEEDFSTLNVNAEGTIDADDTGLSADWTFSLGDTDQVVTDAANVCSGTSAIRVDSDSDYILTPDNGGKILDFTFKVKCLEGAINYKDYYPEYFTEDYWEVPGQIYVEGWDGYKWVTCPFYFYLNEEMLSDYVSMTGFASYVSGKYYQVKLTFTDFSDYGVVIALDDFYLQTTAATERIDAYNDLEVEGLSYTFTGLEPELDYYYYVKAVDSVNGIDSGDPTGCIDAFGISTPVIDEATEIDGRGAYTANWEYTPKATDYRVRNYRVYTAPEDETDYVVLHEDFSNITSQATPTNYIALNNFALTSLDELVGEIGWVGYLAGYANGAIGIIGYSEYGMGGEVQSPILSLNNDNGTCRVSVTACGAKGDYLMVVNSTGVDGFYYQFTKDYEYETFNSYIENCTEGDYLVFYSYYKYPAFVSEVTVTQNLQAGDKVHHMVDYPYTEELDYRFSGLETGSNISYAYDVYSVYRRYGSTTSSIPSEKQYVNMPSSVPTISAGNGNSDVTVAVGNGTIEVTTAVLTDVTIADMTGRTIATAGQCGTKSYSVAPGLYIVSGGSSTCKVIVK